jgi:hypothetical protein
LKRLGSGIVAERLKNLLERVRLEILATFNEEGGKGRAE